MWLYLGIVIFYVICMFIENLGKKKIPKKAWIFFLMIPPFFLTALRAPNVGNDTQNYYNSFMIITQEALFSQSASRLESGYVLLNRLIGIMDLNYLGFQIITAIFIYFSFGRFIYKYSSNYAASLFVFVSLNMFFQTMNISRQYIAIAILTYSIGYILKKKPLKFISVVLLASFFHQSALIFMVIYYVSNTILTKSKILLLIFVGIVGSLGFDYFLRISSPLLGGYEGYTDSVYFNTEGNIAVYFVFLIYLTFFIIGYFNKYGKEKGINEGQFKIKESNNKIRSRSEERIIFSAVVITLILSIVGLNTSIMSRLISYFLIFYLLYIPDLFTYIRNKYLKPILNLYIVGFLFTYFVVIMIYRPGWTGVIPYFWHFE